MRLEFEVTKNDLVDVELYNLKKVRSSGLFGYIVLCFIVTSVIFTWITFLGFMAYYPIAFEIVFSIIVGVLLFNKRARAKRIVNRGLKSGAIEAQYFGHHTLELGESGIILQYGTIKTELLYAGIQKIEQYPKGIMFFISQSYADVIPLSAFDNAQQRIEFLSKLQSCITLAKNVEISDESIEEQRQQAVYTLEYTWSESEIIDAMQKANRMLYTTRLGWTTGQIAITIAGLYLIVAAVNGIWRFFSDIAQTEQDSLSTVTIVFLFIGVTLLLNPLIALIPPWTRKLISARIASGAISRDYIGKQILCVKNDRLTEIRRLACHDIMFDKLYRIKNDDNNVYILLKGKRFVIVPNSAFQSPERAQEVIQFIESKMHR